MLALNSLEMKLFDKDLSIVQVNEIAAEIQRLKDEIRGQVYLEEMQGKNKPSPKWD